MGLEIAPIGLPQLCIPVWEEPPWQRKQEVEQHSPRRGTDSSPKPGTTLLENLQNAAGWVVCFPNSEEAWPSSDFPQHLLGVGERGEGEGGGGGKGQIHL